MKRKNISKQFAHQNSTPKISSERTHQIKTTLIDMALASLTLAEDTNNIITDKLQLKFPLVMNKDGKMVSADKLILQYDAELANHVSSNIMTDNFGTGVVGSLYGVNQFTFNQVNQLLIDNVFLGYAEYSILMQNGILSSICSTPADKMTSEWIEFVSFGGIDATHKIKELELEFERLDVRNVFNQAAKFCFGMGGCLVYPHYEGDYDNNELYEELYIDSATLKGRKLEYIKLIEPIWYVPIRYVTDNPFSKWFYVPEYYAVMGKICHSTRVFKFIYNEAPNVIKSQYNFNGIPILQQAIPYVTNFKTFTNTITEIVQSLNLLVLKTGLQSIAEGAMSNADNELCGSGANLGNRIRALNATRNNLGTAAIDSDAEDLYNLNMQLQTLDKLWSQAAEFMCIIPKIPATELLGISPQGFNTAGDYERKRYDKQISDWQNQIFRPHLVKIMQMAMINIWGEIDKNISFNFKKLGIPDELEQSTINLNKSTEAAVYFDRGIVSSQDIQKKLSTDKNSDWNELEIEEENYENLETETVEPTENLSGGNYGVENNPYNNNSNATGPAF